MPIAVKVPPNTTGFKCPVHYNELVKDWPITNRSVPKAATGVLSLSWFGANDYVCNFPPRVISVCSGSCMNGNVMQ